MYVVILFLLKKGKFHWKQIVCPPLYLKKKKIVVQDLGKPSFILQRLYELNILGILNFVWSFLVNF